MAPGVGKTYAMLNEGWRAHTRGKDVVIGTGAWQVAASVDDTQVGLVKAGDQAVIVPNGSTRESISPGRCGTATRSTAFPRSRSTS